MNLVRTGVLLAGLTALYLIVGGLLGGRGGMMIALGFAVATNFYAWWRSDRLALDAVGARPVDAQSAPELHALVAGLAGRAGLPVPALYIVDDPHPNAFATGRDPEHAAIAVHTGLLDLVTKDELSGVLAHELAHIRNRDTLTMTITATLAGAISSIAHWGFYFGGGRRRTGLLGALAIAILAPMAAMLVQMAISRSREYAADAEGGALCGNPLHLAGALGRMADLARESTDPGDVHTAMAHLYIVSPLMAGGLASLFASHPDVGLRIAALQDLAVRMGIRPQPGQAPESPAWSPFRTAGAATQGSFLADAPLIAGPWRKAPPRDRSDQGAPPRGPWG